MGDARTRTAVRAALLLLAPVAAAAAPADEAPASAWPGLYLGAQFGGGTSDARWKTDATVADGDSVNQRASSPALGVQLGARFRVSRHWLVGAEGSYSLARLRTVAQSQELAERGLPGRSRETDFRNLYAVTVQAGYAHEDGWFLYGKAGVAGSYVYLATANVLSGVVSSTHGRAYGWTGGVGVEYLLADRWSFGVEYDHYELRLGDRSAIQSNGAVADYIGFKGSIEALYARLNRTF